ncbi:MAG: hypothetical protein WBQ55_18710, partial [Xanthobacteraceae bacterium]
HAPAAFIGLRDRWRSERAGQSKCPAKYPTTRERAARDLAHEIIPRCKKQIQLLSVIFSENQFPPFGIMLFQLR